MRDCWAMALWKTRSGFCPFMVAKHFYKKIIIYCFGGHGHQVRDILHIDDVCNIILIQVKNLNKINNETFNIGVEKIMLFRLKH